MGIAQCEDHVLTLHLSAIADANDIQIFLEAGGNAKNRVGYQRACQTMQRAMIFRIALGVENSVLGYELDSPGDAYRHFPLGALDVHGVFLNIDLHALRQRNWFVSDS